MWRSKQEFHYGMHVATYSKTDEISIEKITHRYPIPGHTYLPNDDDFGVVEKKVKKSRPIYSVEQYTEVLKSAKKSPKPFIINVVSREDFKDLSQKSTNFTKPFQLIDT